MTESRSERQPHVAVQPLKSQDDRSCGQPPPPRLPTEPVICVLPLIWKPNATTDALGCEQPLASADSLAQHQDCDPISRISDEKTPNETGRRKASAFEPPQQLYSLPPSAPPLLTDGRGPPAGASARPAVTVRDSRHSTGAPDPQAESRPQQRRVRAATPRGHQRPPLEGVARRAPTSALLGAGGPASHATARRVGRMSTGRGWQWWHRGDWPMSAACGIMPACTPCWPSHAPRQPIRLISGVGGGRAACRLLAKAAAEPASFTADLLHGGAATASTVRRHPGADRTCSCPGCCCEALERRLVPPCSCLPCAEFSTGTRTTDS